MKIQESFLPSFILFSTGSDSRFWEFHPSSVISDAACKKNSVRLFIYYACVRVQIDELENELDEQSILQASVSSASYIYKCAI